MGTFNRWEHFWTITLETSQLQGVNHELNPGWLYPAIALFKFKLVLLLELQSGR